MNSDPFTLLRGKTISVKATIGVAFAQTHPDAIHWFLRNNADIKVLRDEAGVFHPKIYLFERERDFALIVGSSNFTSGGFGINDEACILIEGRVDENGGIDLEELKKSIDLWRSDKRSFTPTPEWLETYRVAYKEARKKRSSINVFSPADSEAADLSGSWLLKSEWGPFYEAVVRGLSRQERNGQGYHDVLDAAAQKLAMPWTRQLFSKLENRRIMGGLGAYGWLGHVGASGDVRRLLAHGSPSEKGTIVNELNAIYHLPVPTPYRSLRAHLDKLVGLGPTMKVWGRFLCIVRPDRFCTVASPGVRIRLSGALAVSQDDLVGANGYSKAIQALQKAPWFSSRCPFDPKESVIWRRRMAFLDAIFY